MITIYPNKIIRTYGNNNKKKEKVDPRLLLMHLNEDVVLNEKVTFGHIMAFLATNIEMTNFIFAGTMGGSDFKPFYDDMLNKPVEKGIVKEGEYLEVYSYPDIWKFKKSSKITYRGCNGIHIIKGKGKRRETWSLSFLKLNVLKNMPIRINHQFTVVVNDTTIPRTKVALMKALQPILVAELEDFRLYDFLWTMLYEISWYGPPEKRDEQGDKILGLATAEYDFENTKEVDFGGTKIKMISKKKTN